MEFGTLFVFFLLFLQSQQKCIANFALLCCLAVLVALIVSSVNVWGDVEDDVTEENCSSDCRYGGKRGNSSLLAFSVLLQEDCYVEIR